MKSSPTAPPAPAPAEPQASGADLPGGRLQSIDTLRGLAAIAVVVCHVALAHEGKWSKVARGEHPWLEYLWRVADYGREGVPLFFVISGFCIHLRWAKSNARFQAEGDAGAQETAPSVRFWGFWGRRLWRLYPPYLAALAFSMGVTWLQWRATRTVDWSFGSPRGMAIDTLVHIPMLHGLHPDFDFRGGNGAFWTLAREEYFYLAYFPLLWLRRRLGISITVFVVGLVGATVPLLWPSVVSGLELEGEARKVALFSLNAENSALALWIQWALGMIAVEAFCERRTLPAWARSGGASAAWLALAVFSREKSGPGFVTVILWGMGFWTLINYVVAREVSGSWPHANRVVRWLSWAGTFSYSLYLVHRPFLVLWRKAELALLEKIGQPSLESQPWLLLIEWTASIVACLIAGRVFYFLIERHFLKPPPKIGRAARGG